MSTLQLAIRFTDEQVQTLDALAAVENSTRSAVVKRLVDEARRLRIDALYAAAYPIGENHIDGFGDLDAFHGAAQAERVDSRSGKTTW